MKIYVLISILITAELFSCEQANRSTPETVETETATSVKNVQNNKDIYTNYKYTDSNGDSVTVQNGFPRGGLKYNDPTGKEYSYALFWSRIINETDKPLELRIDFPVDLYEIPGLSGNYYKVLVPPDTFTIDKVSLYDYGLIDLKSLLDKNILKPSLIKRTIYPKESSGFYTIILSHTTEGAPHFTLRTELNLHGQSLFYKVSRFDNTSTHSLMDEKQISCGSISLKDLTLKN